METKIKTIFLLTSLLFSFSLASDDAIKIGDVEMTSEKKSVAFEQVKKKLGKWEGTMVQGLNGAVIMKTGIATIAKIK